MADTINPNIPDFVVVSGATVPVTDDPRWVDGGIHYSAPDFNLDNPRMWTPMSVISGLASGFCERAAYVTGGSALGLKWVNAAPKENASNAAQAQKTANNMALAGGVESSFIQAKDPEFSLPVNMPFSNYMAAFDNALSTILLSPYGGYKTITGGTYTFDLLATAAYVRADGDIEQPSAGGWSYREPFDYTYPAQWAKERKWMLDELKYTSDPRPNHEFPSVIAVCATSNGLFPTVSSSAIGYAVRNSLYKQLISSCNSAGDGYVASEYLKEKGFRIVARNFRYSHKEIDIIAENDTTLIFVEVKARTNCNNQLYHYGHRPCDAVNKQKQRLVASAVLHYLKLNPTNKGLRIDIIEVFFSPYRRFGKPLVERVHHIEGAFGVRY